ncbi:glycosyltransferase family A protein [Priestia megaterium]|uniref:glycosyltransferase family A protein n=1 Tax=Priestia megaterium TaxID=1404 RepID=UPI00204169F8|nr:glycosyltransferase family A protein [Priestia megaterium]MCM3308579.1 glycosyltransferase family 2 protein [Priestia megaterium]
MSPIVSIILTSYNKPYYLEKAITSILNQTETNWELIIMDDNSNKETVDIIMRFLYDRRISYFNSFIDDTERYNTTRYATLINAALSLAKGQYISYLTDDTLYVPTRLAEMISYFKDNSTIKAIYSSQLVKNIGLSGKVIDEFVRPAKNILQDACFKVDHCSVMHEQSLLKTIHEKYKGYWNDHKNYWNHADCIFWRRINEITPFYPIDKILDITYKTPTSVQNILRNIPNKIIDGTLVRGTTKEVYLIKNQARKQMSDGLFNFYKYTEADIVSIPDLILLHYPISEPVDVHLNIPDYLVIMEKETKKLYYLEGGMKREFKNLNLINKLKFNRKRIVDLKKSLLISYPTGKPFTDLNPSTFIPPARKVIKINNEYWIFLHGNLSKIDVRVAKYFNLLNQSISLPKVLFEKFPKGEDITLLTQKPL